MSEHPTDSIEHGIPEELPFKLKGEAAMTVRTLAEIYGKQPVQIVSEALGLYREIEDMIQGGAELQAVNPDGSTDKLEVLLFRHGNSDH